MSLAIINDYHGRNNLVPVMDSLLMNERILVSGMGYKESYDGTAKGESSRINTVNGLGVSGSDWAALRLDSGFVGLNLPVVDSDDYGDYGGKLSVAPFTSFGNSDKALNVGTFLFRESRFGLEEGVMALSDLEKSYYLSNGIALPEAVNYYVEEPAG